MSVYMDDQATPSSLPAPFLTGEEAKRWLESHENYWVGHCSCGFQVGVGPFVSCRDRHTTFLAAVNCLLEMAAPGYGQMP